MTCDASPAALRPMTNGTLSHREVGASTTSSASSTAQPPSRTPTLRETCADLHGRVQRFLAAGEGDEEVVKRTQAQVRISIEVIDKALQDYAFDTLSLSYNGGKDCLVLLIIYLSCLNTHFTRLDGDQKHGEFPTSIPSIYAKPPDPFPQVSSFVDSSSREYHLDLVHISTNPGPPGAPKAKSHSSPPESPDHERSLEKSYMEIDKATQDKPIVSFRDAFSLYLDSRPQTRAIFVGTRRTDPHGAHLTHFDMTDGNWPRFMRIHPVIDWQLAEVWCFLRSPHLADPATGELLEYCSMYDEGYTSLGGVGDTLRNPKLKYTGEGGKESFRPAYQMTEDLSERAGRE